MAENMYYVLAKFYVLNEGWLTLKAESPDQAKELLLKEFVGNESVKDFEILDVRDKPPILDEVELEEQEDIKPETIN